MYNLNMHAFYFYLLLIFNSFTLILNANESHLLHTSDHHDHGTVPSKIMFAYQIGYSEIHSKNNNKQNESGVLLGIHLMTKLRNKEYKNRLFLGAGAHTVLSDNRHIGLMLGIMYKLNKHTFLSIMPGVMFMKHQHANSHGNMPMHMPVTAMPDPKWETEEAIHVEFSHTISLLSHILNPSFSWMSTSSHNQYSLGLNYHF